MLGTVRAQGLLANLVAIIVVHMWHLSLSENIDWSHSENKDLFVNVYTLGDVSEAKVSDATLVSPLCVAW